MRFQGRRFENGETIYSEWFARGGDIMLIRGQAVDRQASSGAELMITIYTKNADDAGDPADPMFSNVSSSTPYSLTLDDPSTNDGFAELVVPSAVSGDNRSGIKEMVRIKATCDSGWILARIFPPIFYDDAH